jgi:thiol-disulfide isomerase/thioredoxin
MKAILVSLAILASTLTIRAAEATPSAKLSQFKLGEYITGPQVTLDNATGKAVLIDAWGIHCGPCLASLPDIEKISKHYKDKMLVFGAHSQAGTDDEVKDVVKKNKLTYTITKGVNSPISFSGIPRVFVFDTTGALVYTGSPFDAEFEKSLRKATKDAGTSGGAAKPSGLDALKRPGA